MAGSQPPSPMSGAPPPGLSAQTVIDMFTSSTGFGLPAVCDDAALIERKYEEQKPRRDKESRSTTESVRQVGNNWFKTSVELRTRRHELLDIVYSRFVNTADVAFEVAKASGVKTLTPELEKSLLNIAFRECRADQTVADRFLARYIKERDLPPPGKPLVRPAVVSGFTAAGGKGKVTLAWTLPSSHCDEVVIVREQNAASGRRASDDDIYRGKGTGFVDGGVEPGVWYRYRIRSVYQGVEGPDTVDRAACVGEVRGAGARWNNGQVEVTWKPFGVADVPVAVFRRAGAAPTVRRTASGVEPGDASTTQVHRGSGTTLLDREVVEGTTYHYRLIAEFGQDLFSDGVGIQVMVPRPPSAVASVSARYERHQDQELVAIDWPPVPGLSAEYIVVRREGSAPAGDLQGGRVFEATRQTRVLDHAVVSGARYCYSVFTRVGDDVSRSAASSAPVDILTDVAELRADAGDGAVELSWTTPPSASSVIVRRSLSEPRDHTDGSFVRLTGADHAKDAPLANARRYHYLVCCGYRPDGVHEVLSRGVRTSAMPEQLPDPVSDFRATVQGQMVVCTWSPPVCGQAIVLRSAIKPPMPAGSRMPTAAMRELGSHVDGAEDTQPTISEPWYSVYTVAGDRAVFGGSDSAVVCADVTDLKLSATREGIVLRWVWPAESKMARVVRRADTWPTGPDDPAAISMPCSHVEYLNGGDKFVDVVHETRARFYYVVYAQPVGAQGMFFSPGTDPGCRDTIEWAPWMTLRYRLTSPADAHQKGKSLRLAWDVEQPLPGFAGFVLVASQTQIPNALDDGIPLFEWRPNGAVAGTHEAEVSLEPIRKRRWARFFAKAIVTDRSQAHATLVVHPNVSRPIFETGDVEAARITIAPDKAFSLGPPKTLVCPWCFEKFPLSAIRFSSFAGGDSRPANYTALDRLLNRAPQPPKDAQGRLLTRKHCPNDHELPFTAGGQSSLVIGLIGAKFSGKSHYVASLVNQLHSQAGTDLQAALLPVTEETQERYRRDFYDPLFRDKLELSLTVGTPPPLIYDLSIDGQLWPDKRSRIVTLALYDTAGENLRDAETVRQMLKYLRVASGVIFLIDPLQAPAVRDAIPSRVQAPPLDPDAEPSAMLSRVLQEIDDGKLVTGSAALATPVAVVLTKCDVLRDAGLIEPNRLWSSEARHIGKFDVEAHEDMAGMMSEYVQRWSPAAYQIVSRRFTHHAFFGASATGCASDAATRRYKYIAPWRVEDPLLWLLSVLGVLQVREPRL